MPSRKAVSIRAVTTSALQILLCLLLLGQIATSHAARDSSTSPALSADSAFRAQAKEFIEAELRLYPERATALGDHRYDDQLADLSPGRAVIVIRHAKQWLKKFGGDDPSALSPANEADREWLIAQADGELLRVEQLRDYEREPGLYLPTSAINSLIKREFAPAEVRMRSVTAREVAALKNLDAARRVLDPALTPKVAVDIALQQIPATLGFFRNDVPAAFAKVADGPDRRAFAKANATLAAAIEGYAHWLKNDLMPRSVGSYAIGADAYRRMLNDADMVDMPLAKLEQVGEVELARAARGFQEDRCRDRSEALAVGSCAVAHKDSS